MLSIVDVILADQYILLLDSGDILIDQSILLQRSENKLFGQYVLLQIWHDALVDQYILLPLGEDILSRQNVLLSCRVIVVYQHKNVLMSNRGKALVRVEFALLVTAEWEKK